MNLHKNGFTQIMLVSTHKIETIEASQLLSKFQFSQENNLKEHI